MAIVRRTRALARASSLYPVYTSVKYSVSRRARATVFDSFYHNNIWGDAESRSGAGSSITRTAGIRDALPGIVQDHEIHSMLDIPCGDWRWMETIIDDLDLDLYIGGEIVQELVDSLRIRYGKPFRQFLVLDAVSDPLPQADLLLCRDLLIHLPNALAAKALRNLQHSGSRWLLSSTSPTIESNVEIRLGLYRPVNLTISPFHLPVPLEYIVETDSVEQPDSALRTLGLWDLADLR
jgi:hypothetical protein